jgi:hypothetical protein
MFLPTTELQITTFFTSDPFEIFCSGHQNVLLIDRVIIAGYCECPSLLLTTITAGQDLFLHNLTRNWIRQGLPA